ncbi:hypothetical protein ACWGJQ_27120 [Peribacillus simplex]
MVEELEWNPYPEAVDKYGEPDFDECFGMRIFQNLAL